LSSPNDRSTRTYYLQQARTVEPDALAFSEDRGVGLRGDSVVRSVQWVSSAVLGAVATGVLGAGLATPASAVTPPPPKDTPYDSAQEIALGINGPATLVVAGERVFVADVEGDRVLVLNRNGATVATIGNQNAPASMTPSPDGSTVFVALRDANAISALDVATAAETGRWSVQACPTETALSSGRLFYSYGCSSEFGVASVDPSSTADPVTALASLLAKPKLAGSATHLVVANEATMGRVRAFTSNTDGSVNVVASSDAEFQGVRDLAVSPDGTRVAVAAWFPGAQSLTLPSLGFAGVSGDDSQATAYSSDGSRLLVGGASGNTVQMYNAITGAMQWQRYSASPSHGAGWHWDGRHMLPASVGFAGDNSLVYALAANADDNADVRLFRSSTSPATPTVSIAVKTAFKRATQVTVSVSGVSSGTVRLAHVYGGMAEWAGNLAVSNGIARKTLPAHASGRVEVIYLGDAGHTASEAKSASFKRASRVSIAMMGTKTVTKNGINRYATYEDVTVRFAIAPKLARQVLYVDLWTLRKGKWVTDGYTTHRLDDTGKVELVFKKRVPGKLSFTAHYKGNARYGESGAGGAVFTIAK
jgi:hypothetical protein